MIRWAEPLWLIVLIIPLLIFFFDLGLRKSRKKARERFATHKLWHHLSPERSDSIRRGKKWLFIIALTFLIIGLANPQIGTRYEEVTRQGIDIFLLIDVSRSMDTQDIRPSRISKTRYELANFMEGLQGDRIGIIPFAGNAYALCPLTLDYSAASMFLDILSTDLIPNPGTNIGEAINTAMKSFNFEDSRGRAIILVSDGEDHEGGAVEAAQMAAKKGVKIFTIGMALTKGDPIPDDKPARGNKSGWKTDDQGHIITSKLNEDLLREIANVGQGSYFRASQGGAEFQSVYKKLFGMERKELEARQITDFEDRFQPFLIISILLLALEFIIPSGRRKPHEA